MRAAYIEYSDAVFDVSKSGQLLDIGFDLL